MKHHIDSEHRESKCGLVTLQAVEDGLANPQRSFASHLTAPFGNQQNRYIKEEEGYGL